jgi:hypothetical protein
MMVGVAGFEPKTRIMRAQPSREAKRLVGSNFQAKPGRETGKK